MRFLINRMFEKAMAIHTLFIAIMILLITGWISGIAIADDMKIKDSDITNEIESRLETDDAVYANMLDVETKKGIVYLSGWADNLLAKERATEIARATMGVISVVNNIEVNPKITRTVA